MTAPITNSQAKRIMRFVIVALVVQMAFMIYVFIQAYETRVTDVENKRSGCERGKLDRRDNADFQRAHTWYIHEVVLAQSVKPDVKNAARKAIKTYERTSASLTRRAHINCEKLYPKAKVFR